jgi:phosphate transport system permease protein
VNWSLGKVLFFTPVALFLGAVLFLWGILIGKFLGLCNGEMTRFLLWEWSPASGNFGILPMVVNTVCLAICSTLLAFTWAFGISLFLQGIGPRFLAKPVLFLVRAMSSVPSIIFALLGALYVIPFIRLYSNSSGYSLIANILTLSFFLLPFQTKLCTSAFSAAEDNIGISAEVRGFNTFQKIFWVLVPETKKALIACAAMGFCRSLGDTMISLLVSGNSPQLPESIFSPIRVLTAHIALVASTDSFSPVFDSLFVTLAFLLTLTVATTFLTSRLLKSGYLKS